MTGIERLRKLAGDFTHCRLWYVLISGTEDGWGCYRDDVRTVSDELLSIADQIDQEARAPFSRVRVLAVISDMKSRVSDEGGSFGALVARWARELLGAVCSGERDPAEDVSVSAYDLLPADEREAIAWVREHGGLAQVEMDYAVFEGFSDLADEVARRLGLCIDGLDAQDSRPLLMDALDRRLMPEGVEWMLWDDGKPVTYDDAPDDVIGVYLALDGSGYVLMTDLPDQLMSEPSERVRRPAVPAGDGEPLEVGQTVWDTDAEADTPLTVVEVSSDLVRCEYTWKDGKTYRLCYQPDQLTHQRPDSWKRIEEDATLSPEVYCHRNGIDISQKDGTEIFLADTVEPMARDLVRRAKRLAERGE